MPVNVSGGVGDVHGPASASDGNIVVFDGVTGKIVKDGGPVPSGGGFIPLTYNEEEVLRLESGFIPGQQYKITDFRTNHFIVDSNGAQYIPGPTDPQIDKVILQGTSGTCDIKVGGVTHVCTFNSDLPTTASDFVTAFAAEYLVAGITLTADGGTLVFTASVVGSTGWFSNALLVNTSGNLYGNLQVTIVVGQLENLIIEAISVSALSPVAYSQEFPQDLLQYNSDPTSFLLDHTFAVQGDGSVIIDNWKGAIIERIDTDQNVRFGYDFRNCRARRWVSPAIAWDSGHAYAVNDKAVGSDGIVYSCYVANTAQDPTTSGSSYWNEYWNQDVSKYSDCTGSGDYADFVTFVDGVGSATYAGMVRNWNVEPTVADTITVVRWGAISHFGNHVFYVGSSNQSSFVHIGSGSANFTAVIDSSGDWEIGANCGTYSFITIGSGCYVVTIGSYCGPITIGSYSGPITIDSYSGAVTIGSYSGSVTIGSYSGSVTIGSYSYPITIGSYCGFVTIGSYCGFVTIGSYSYSVTIGSYSYPVTIGSYSYSVTIGSHSGPVTIGDEVTNIILPDNTKYAEFEQGFDGYGINFVGITQIETLTLSGTNGTANVTVAGGLTSLASFNADLPTTASDFVTAFAVAYLSQGIVLTSNNADIIFTAQVQGTGFAAPIITNVTGDLSGSVVDTQANQAPATLLTTVFYKAYSMDKNGSGVLAQVHYFDAGAMPPAEVVAPANT